MDQLLKGEHMIQHLHLSVEIPSGYVATGEYRKPLFGEYFLTVGGTAQTVQTPDKCALNNYRIILRKVWSFPAWFAKGWWLYFNCHSQLWLVTTHRPEPAYGMGPLNHWQQGGSGGPLLNAVELWQFHGEEFTPPTEFVVQC
jgi:hypothetical protein